MVDPDVRETAGCLRRIAGGALLLNLPVRLLLDSREWDQAMFVDVYGAAVLAWALFRLSRVFRKAGEPPTPRTLGFVAVGYALMVLMARPMGPRSAFKRSLPDVLLLLLLVGGRFLASRLVARLEAWRLPAAAHRIRRTRTLYGWLFLLPLAYFHAAAIAFEYRGEWYLPPGDFYPWAGFLAGFVPLLYLFRTARVLEREAEIADWLEP